MARPLHERARRQRARADDLRDRRHAPARSPTHGLSPEVDPEQWPQRPLRARLGLEPDVDRAAPVAEAPRGAARAARGWCVVDPFRSRTARVADEHLRPLPGTDAALALGMMRAIVDAGPRRRGVVPRARRRLRRAARAARRASGRALGRASAASPAEDDRPRRRASSRRTQPALLRLGVGAQRHLGAPIAYRTIACLPALVGAWRHARRRLLVHPDGDRERASLQRAHRRRRPAARAGARRSTCRSSARR